MYLTGPLKSMATWVTSALDQCRIALTTTGLSLCAEEVAAVPAFCVPVALAAAGIRARSIRMATSEYGSGVRKTVEGQPVTPEFSLTVYTGSRGIQTAPSGDIGGASLNLKRCTLPVAVLGN